MFCSFQTPRSTGFSGTPSLTQVPVQVSSRVKYARNLNASGSLRPHDVLMLSADYQGTAVKLQAEWDIVDPQSLDFAPHVQSHALVHILQRGLLFHEAERKAARVS